MFQVLVSAMQAAETMGYFANRDFLDTPSSPLLALKEGARITGVD